MEAENKLALAASWIKILADPDVNWAASNSIVVSPDEAVKN